MQHGDRAADQQHRIDQHAEQDQEDDACAIAGGVWPTSMVGGISRSGTSLRNLNHAIVGANEPIPRVSKKLVIAPSSDSLDRRPRAARSGGADEQHRGTGAWPVPEESEAR